jgi:hypothetical protein
MRMIFIHFLRTKRIAKHAQPGTGSQIDPRLDGFGRGVLPPTRMCAVSPTKRLRHVQARASLMTSTSTTNGLHAHHPREIVVKHTESIAGCGGKRCAGTGRG